MKHNRASDLEKKVRLGKFLENIRGIYYYGTPHHGSPLMNTKVHYLESNLFEYFKLLSKEGARLNEKFEQLCRLYPKWRIHGLGESRSTKSGLFHGVVGAPEATSRARDSFHFVEADHIQICRPETTTSRSFYGLVEVLESIAKDVKEEEARVQEEKARAAEKARLQNLQYLPKQIIGIEVPVQEVKTKLVESRTLGLVGMGGCGKTTLAKAIFNNLESGFEYSSFVAEVKLISGRVDDVKKEVWSQMHHFGKEMAAKPEWSLLKEKSLLLVLDDVSSDRDLEVLFDIAKDLSPESRFVVTSRDRDLLRILDHTYEVPFLSVGIARELFIRHAFPEQMAPPSQLESLVDAIVEKCDGLPLTLEIIGKYLYKRDEKQDWEQTLIALGRADSVAHLNERLWEKLKWSFLGLQEEEQQFFLDVATFFCPYPYCTLGEAKVLWKATYAISNERLLWRTLVDRCLVYDVQDSETIRMHEQLLDLGRKLGAKQNRIRRVWDEKEAMSLFQSTLQRHDETLPESFGHLRALSHLEFNYCYGLQTLPESFGHLSALTNIQFNWCKELQTLPESFRHLSALTNLQFKSCDGLQTLPESFGHLSALTNLQFNYCYGLQTLPESFGHLSALTNLQFKSCVELQTLPESFGHLSALTNLEFDCCYGLQTLPESFGHLSAFSNLQFDCCYGLLGRALRFTSRSLFWFARHTGL